MKEIVIRPILRPMSNLPSFVEYQRILTDGWQQYRLTGGVVLRHHPSTNRLRWEGRTSLPKPPLKGSLEEAFTYYERTRPVRHTERRKEEEARQRQEVLEAIEPIFQSDEWPAWLDANPYPSKEDEIVQPYKDVFCGAPWPDTLESPFTFTWRLLVRPDRLALIPSTHPLKGWHELYVLVPRVHARLGGASLRAQEGIHYESCFFYNDCFLFVIREPGTYMLSNLRKRPDTVFKVERKRPLSPVLDSGGPFEWSGIYGSFSEKRYFRLAVIEEDEPEITGSPSVLV